MSTFGRFARLAVMVLAATLVAVLASGMLLAEAQGTGPADAIRSAQGSMPIEVGQHVWYAFGYTGDGSQIVIRMPASPKSAVGFSVWTQAEIDAWARGGREDPVGRGSPNAALGDDLVWSGNFNTDGTYYVRVEQKGTAPGRYRLQITGKDVQFAAAADSTPSVTTTGAPAAAPVAQPASVAAPVARAGSGPADALSATSQWTPVAVGEDVWYAFQYKGDRSQILVRMAADPKSAVGFSVWTQAEIDAWARGGREDPIGRGSPNTYLGGDQVWSGNFPLRGTYYVRVEQKGAAAGNYNLQITGKGVTF